MKTSRKHAGIWFQSTHSLRSATSNGKKISLAATFQSTHSLRSATHAVALVVTGKAVSIHALLAECDLVGIGEPKVTTVSIHALLAECDLRAFPNQTGLNVSIHALLAECDFVVLQNAICPHCFNPRTPCGVRQQGENALSYIKLFQSTHSLRSATGLHCQRFQYQMVSIHALLAECDLRPFARMNLKNCFNPRTPCGVRRTSMTSTASWGAFQSTHSLRSATWAPETLFPPRPVSIHALLAECDIRKWQKDNQEDRFNPRTPCGVRLKTAFLLQVASKFQSTHSLRSATLGLP